MSGGELRGKRLAPGYPRAAVGLLAIATTLLIVLVLRETAWMTGTLALAFFAALALWPIDHWIRAHLPPPLRWLGHAAALVVMLLAFLLFSAGLFYVVQQIAQGLVRYQEPLEQLTRQIGRWIRIAGEGGGEGTASLAERLVDPVISIATTIMQSVWSFAGILTLLYFLVWLILLETPSFSAKLAAMTSYHDGATLRRIVEATASRFRRYLVVRTVLGIATGALYVLWLWWWNLDFLLVWGLLAFMLNYIPTVGSIIAGILPMTLAVLQRDPASALVIGAGLLLIEQFMGNYVDPRLQGRELSISPLVVLVALMFWTWVWGLLGAILAVPMTLVITIAFSRVEALRPIALALSNAEDMEDLKDVTTA
ncbi:AI-2E family transporter [Chelativorans sp. AA-79]|uniref:AI-2E family transporter n=1 Tax=Chelativorans sp. AA-79 TaxID=3028735 RepID=UPI0023F709D1|nr:AI-2E family transporter [Chelativorans sp. AA-79]WEX07105.1 AI-2E family transporter [Chelativorans sp. AA-79]